MMFARLVILSLVTLLLAGCPQPMETVTNDNTPPAQPDDEGPTTSAPHEPPDASDPTSVNVTLATWEDVEKQIAAQQGKVVVVDLWSTTCEPCKREFPGLVKLHNEHGEDVACIAVSLDYYGDPTKSPESYLPAVKEFLAEQNAEFPNFISSVESDKVLQQVGANSVPTVLVYDREGNLAKMFEDDGSYGDEGFTYEKHITPLAEKLAATSASG